MCLLPYTVIMWLALSFVTLFFTKAFVSDGRYKFPPFDLSQQPQGRNRQDLWSLVYTYTKKKYYFGSSYNFNAIQLRKNINVTFKRIARMITLNTYLRIVKTLNTIRHFQSLKYCPLFGCVRYSEVSAYKKISEKTSDYK